MNATGHTKFMAVMAVSFVVGGCATALPPSPELADPAGRYAAELQEEIGLIDGSPISVQNKAYAKAQLKTYHACRMAADAYGMTVKNNIGKNSKLNSNYSLINALVAAVGGATAFSEPGIAVASAIWNVTGLVIQKTSVEPAILAANETDTSLQLTSRSFSSSAKEFRGMVTEADATKAAAHFSSWSDSILSINAGCAEYFRVSGGQRVQ